MGGGIFLKFNRLSHEIGDMLFKPKKHKSTELGRGIKRLCLENDYDVPYFPIFLKVTHFVVVVVLFPCAKQ